MTLRDSNLLSGLRAPHKIWKTELWFSVYFLLSAYGGKWHSWWNTGAEERRRASLVVDWHRRYSTYSKFVSQNFCWDFFTVNSPEVNLRKCHPPLLLSNGCTHLSLSGILCFFVQNTMNLKHTKVSVPYWAASFLFWPALMTRLTTTIALVQLNLGRTSHTCATETHTLTLSTVLLEKHTQQFHPSPTLTLQRFPNPAVIFTQLAHPPALKLMRYHVPECGLRMCVYTTHLQTRRGFDDTQCVAEKMWHHARKERNIRVEALTRH